MPRLQSVSVQGLFGYVDHRVELSVHSPTVITGPNGTGKTHVLRLIDATLNGDVLHLLEASFREVEILFEDRVIRVQRSLVPKTGVQQASVGRQLASAEQAVLKLEILKEGHEAAHAETNSTECERARGETRETPPWIVQAVSGRYIDTRTGRHVPATVAERNYPLQIQNGALRESASGRRVLDLLNETRSVFIDTKRLDSEVRGAGRPNTTRMGDRAASESEARIMGYIRQIRNEIAAARNDSLDRSQFADLRFADRALQAARSTIRVDDLKGQYAHVIDLYEEMARNGLAPDETPAPLPNKPNPTEKRILALLLDAWSDRLEPLAPINKKLTDLRSVLDSKLASSGKRTSVRRGGRLGIESIAGHGVPVSQLSSGEQHLIAIFSQLLFATHTGSLVLIDEPEISMHMSWQHAFLEDVERVASISDLQVILATHSTGIINGRWDLTRELSLPPLQEFGVGDGLEHDESELDDEV